jgi:ribosomal protein L37AE/L43A
MTDEMIAEFVAKFSQEYQRLKTLLDQWDTVMDTQRVAYPCPVCGVLPAARRVHIAWHLKNLQ